MRNRSYRFLAVAGLLLSAGVVLQAQSFVLRANIPFEFSAGNTVLPAGDYMLIRDISSGARDALAIVSGDHTTTYLFTVQIGGGAANKKSDSTLLFQRYGDRHFLSQVWVSGDNIGQKTLLSKTERELSKQAAVRRDTVTILARR